MTIIIVLNAPVEEQIGGWNVLIKQYTEVEYVVVKRKYFIILSYNSRFCLVDVQASVVYLANAPSQLSWEGILGEPKEEIGNLTGFEYMYLSNLKLPYFFVLLLRIHKGYFHGHDSVLLHSPPQTREPKMAWVNPLPGTCYGTIVINGTRIWGHRGCFCGDRGHCCWG